MDVGAGQLGRFPVLTGGAGAPLVYLGGLAAGTGGGTGAVRRMNAGAIAAFAGARRVTFVNRRADLPRGMTMAGLAAEHAEALRGAFSGPVDVLGLSTGGSIAQQLAADHPDVVRGLVLVSTACRLGPVGRRLQRQVAARVRAGAHRQAAAMLTGALAPAALRVPAGAAGWLAGPWLYPDRRGWDDMATTIEAEDAFDLARCGRAIAAPTLIVAGARDRFYEPGLFRETADLIPGARLRLRPGRGHITVTTERGFAPAILGFLETRGR